MKWQGFWRGERGGRQAGIGWVDVSLDCLPALFVRSGNSHTGEWHITVHGSGGGQFLQRENLTIRAL